ncbi:hypothetical protein L0B52_05540 [Suttonella sp. R2A3]|uniref:hypothetical protein n=1 Tax=Suttonella sp. R2A3 TaxID=2908648 RepID=UPI001F319A4D|nr:hypothetical protein [Suttonella sp. R2A3]UJF23813.1 hypothetical protein L0B52_05540 [Suttonella sp. R2A3]
MILKNEYIVSAVSICLLCYFLVIGVAKSAYNYPVGFLLLMTIFLCRRWWSERPKESIITWLSIAFLMMAVVNGFDAWRSGMSSGYTFPVIYLFFLLILRFLCVYPPKIELLFWGVALGSVAVGVTTQYYIYFAPDLIPNGRASRYLNPIQFGNLSMLLAVLCLCGLLMRYKKKIIFCCCFSVLVV